MPTFLIVKNGKVTNTLRGADPGGLRSAVLAASADASRGSAQSSAAFLSTGHVLGNKPLNSQATTSRSATGGGGSSFDQYARAAMRPSPIAGLVRFAGIYFTTLLSFDPHGAAEASPFNVQNAR
jgi:thioredoxin 1